MKQAAITINMARKDAAKDIAAEAAAREAADTKQDSTQHKFRMRFFAGETCAKESVLGGLMRNKAQLCWA